ncbi:hypothetical protein NUW58_g4916 [Xylaria curta]|uniref:Uncharacterized protein n=1 Tax=Xylaria curta TaxID=42375 RepID=A0ACC1P6G5_9PEZI|nr:hypothetical protein NUW58_g4916 [Xylaria curta]
MNEEQDTILGNWKKSESGNDKKSAEKNYKSLCCSLFGNDVQVPETAGYNYYVPYYKTNKSVEQLGERNIKYVEQNRLAAQLGLSAGSHQPSSIIHHAQDLSYSQNTINPLLLDEAHHPQDWAQPKTIPSHDSGYDSMPPSEHVRHADSGPYMDPSWSFGFGGWQSNENVAETGAYFHNAIQPRADEVELDWEPGSSDGPAG